MSTATVTEILNQWPDREAVAADAGVEPIAVYRWEKRGRIPGKHYLALLRGAKRRELNVTADDLVRTSPQEAAE